uniref:Allophycocyanin alpha-B chain n=1 Tax=Cyanidium caldarium TaxID=2771 RepID=APCD_CYACA|nr:allophycocyanin gamma subunit [Cyanidium caldarium]Q9TLW4.1 RecName: Full=Allophycocyanin alpha-B chain; AltName: Full=Allophycocyanin gamma chain [Cyanidium caldarium]AAF12940.1 unknown [Cyanidium caldarium]WDB00278.1 allophycocyanin gamma subunit [Cyanidium caldarium]
MSFVSKTIIEADHELRYLNGAELEILRAYLNSSEKRIKVIKTLRDREKEIISKASRKLFQIHPDYIGPGGNASGSRQRALCLRDYGWYLRLITYSIIAGDKNPVERIGLLGVRDMYNSLGVPLIGMVDSIQCLKDAALAELKSEEEVKLAEPYFDFVIQNMAQ